MLTGEGAAIRSNLSRTMRFKDKVAIVTGAASGFGEPVSVLTVDTFPLRRPPLKGAR